MSDSEFSLGWGYSVHFGTFPTLRFTNGGYFYNFYPIPIKRHGRYGDQRGIRTITFGAIYQTLKIHYTFEITHPSYMYINCH